MTEMIVDEYASVDLLGSPVDVRCIIGERRIGAAALLAYEGKLEGLNSFEVRRAVIDRKPLILTLSDSQKFIIYLINTNGTFTAEPLH